MLDEDPRPPRESVVKLLDRYGGTIDPIDDTVRIEVEELRALLGVMAIGMFRTAHKILTNRQDGV